MSSGGRRALARGLGRKDARDGNGGHYTAHGTPLARDPNCSPGWSPRRSHAHCAGPPPVPRRRRRSIQQAARRRAACALPESTLPPRGGMPAQGRELLWENHWK